MTQCIISKQSFAIIFCYLLIVNIYRYFNEPIPNTTRDEMSKIFSADKINDMQIPNVHLKQIIEVKK